MIPPAENKGDYMFDIDKSKKYEFLEAWEKAIDDNSIVITSENTEITYKIENDNKLKYWNITFGNWLVANYIEPKEIFGQWYVTRQ